MEKDRTYRDLADAGPKARVDLRRIRQNDLASLTGWGGGQVDPEGDYVWNLWRPYKCCQRRGQVFLFSIDWMAYPP